MYCCRLVHEAYQPVVDHRIICLLLSQAPCLLQVVQQQLPLLVASSLAASLK